MNNWQLAVLWAGAPLLGVFLSGKLASMIHGFAWLVGPNGRRAGALGRAAAQKGTVDWLKIEQSVGHHALFRRAIGRIRPGWLRKFVMILWTTYVLIPACAGYILVADSLGNASTWAAWLLFSIAAGSVVLALAELVHEIAKRVVLGPAHPLHWANYIPETAQQLGLFEFRRGVLVVNLILVTFLLVLGFAGFNYALSLADKHAFVIPAGSPAGVWVFLGSALSFGLFHETAHTGLAQASQLTQAASGVATLFVLTPLYFSVD